MPSAHRSSWLVQPLSKQHNRAAFACGNEILDRYLKEIASQDARRLIAAPFVLVEATAPKTICGYYTLSSFGIALDELPAAIARKLPSYPIVPTTLLGRLAVDQNHRGQGMGEFLLMNALRRAHLQTSEIASHAIVVDAIDDQAVRFYQHFNFIQFPQRPDRFFLPMKTISALIDELEEKS
ncbi:MAG TPA: GNAT family N-acetyltransferase [Candidatus Binatia bacterium]|jgi:GNAT superfamily N-acetyltransferase